MKTRSMIFVVACLLLAVLFCVPVLADPCGMVAPIAIDSSPDAFLKRKGEQLTYVFHKNGIADMVLQPGFEGHVDKFGMLIPFPSPPSIRKVDDKIFSHIEYSVNPPAVKLSLRCADYKRDRILGAGGAAAFGGRYGGNAIVVLNEEAVGMYQVAVLAAGSADALQAWMLEHQFQYPDGMDTVIDDYVEMGWVFVAVKARVGHVDGVSPRPGIQSVDDTLPEKTIFTGEVQAMAFRYRTDTLVIPMRLSSYNEGPLKNTLYLLTEGPVRITELPESMVKQQVSGEAILNHITKMLPAEYTIQTRPKDENGKEIRRNVELIEEKVTVKCGELLSHTAFTERWQKKYNAEWHWEKRNPASYNGRMKNLMATDLLAARRGDLSHAFEDRAKVLLNISESLGMRGEEIDALISATVKDQREQEIVDVLDDLKGMTFTVIQGDFPRKVLRESNLTIAAYDIDSKIKKNSFGPQIVTSQQLTLIILLALLTIGVSAIRRIRRKRGVKSEV